MSDTTIVLGADGAIPRLDEELPPPSAQTKSKTNVSKFKLLSLCIAALLFVIIGLVAWSKSSEARANVVGPANGPGAKTQTPSFLIKNNPIDNDSVNALKARIRKEEEEAARRRAELARTMQQMNPQPGLNSSAQGDGEVAVPTPMPDDDPFQRKLRSHVLVPVTGHAPLLLASADDRSRHVLPGSAQSNTAEDRDAYRQAEYERRMRALGLDPSGSGDSSAGVFGGGGGGERAGMGARLRQVSNIASVTADRLPNLDYLLKKGSAIPCALKTGIDTQLPGFVLCVAVSDTYSANGRTLLIERGSTFFGEQQSALQRGQNRTFAVWDRGDTPSGISFNIGSPGTDSMGYSGIPGIVNRHLLERFGGAILVSIIDDFAKAAAERMAGDRGITIGGSSAESANSIAEKTLDESINIPSNLIVKPGTVINILVARDVSFENVYQLVR
jgi:type IV secretion system protein VirB10